MRFTKQQRKDIYLMACKRIYTGKSSFCCTALKDSTIEYCKKNNIKLSKNFTNKINIEQWCNWIKEYFKEFNLLEQINKDDTYKVLWDWSYGIDMEEEKLFVMILAYTMCG